MASRTSAALAATAALAHALPAAAQPVTGLRRVLGVADEPAGGPGAALTFDDGPHPQGTPAVLDALAAGGATATFFLVGEQVARHAALAREIVAAGHAVGLHGDRHRNLLRVGPRATRRDLQRGWDRIATATGVEPVVYRPPYGVFNGTALLVARASGWRPLLWTHWGRDWERRATPRTIAARLTDRLGPRAVLLLHDSDRYAAAGSWRATAAALPRVLDHLAASGTPVVPA